MAKVVKEIWDIDGVELPVYIYKERRYNNRISITKKGVNLRVPKMGADIMKGSYKQWAMKWLQNQLAEKPELASRFKTTKYVDGYEINTPHRNYVLRIRRSDRSTSAGKLIGHVLTLDLNEHLSEVDSAHTIKTLISRLIGKDQLSRVSDRIKAINEKYFKQSIKGIRIKNNSSNWGSCSNTGNINISSKTLMAPFEVQDYIFVHELAHRLEMNHSPKYWAIVEKVMPSYRKHEQWIKDNGHLCEF